MLYQVHLVMFFSHLSRFEVMYSMYSGRLLYMGLSIINEMFFPSSSIFSRKAIVSSKFMFVYGVLNTGNLLGLSVCTVVINPDLGLVG